MAQVRAIVDKLLTNVSSALIPTGYVSESLFPTIEVNQTSGLLGKYGNSHLRIQNSVMAGRGKAPRVETITRSTQTYIIENHGLEGLVTQDDYRNVELPFDAEKDEVMGLSTALWLSKEFGLASALTNPAIITQNTGGNLANPYSDYVNSDPIGDFKTARLTVRNGCGLPPNVAVMDWNVANTLAYHPKILSALGFSFTRGGQLTDVELAKAMGVEKLFIAKAVYNNSAEGQSDAIGPVWGKSIVFAHCPDQAVPYQVSLGYYLKYKGSQPRQVYKFPVYNPVESTGILVTDSYEQFVSNAGAGYLIQGAIA